MSGLMFQTRSADEVIQLVEDVGFLPFFANFRRNGYDFAASAYHKEPEESRERIIAHLKTVLPEAGTEQLRFSLKAAIQSGSQT